MDTDMEKVLVEVGEALQKVAEAGQFADKTLPEVTPELMEEKTKITTGMWCACAVIKATVEEAKKA